ncbi:molybdopterin-dependent oxidoreductase [Dyadobacter psychrophilus]|nr:molybdopterin-dependent oxidoreductase [Dyadobacter psychrophilus]
MLKNRTLLLSFYFTTTLMLAATLTVKAQNVATLSIMGEVATPLELKKEDFMGFKSVTYKVRDRDNKEHEFKGAPLIAILEKAGVTTGAKLRGENLAKFVFVTAADGYEVVYALPEIDPEFTDQVILVAIEKDGQPLPDGEGPFRIIVPNDKKQARWTREVRSIKVMFAK